jgi:integrase
VASIKKNGDKWRAQVERHGTRKSKSFSTKAAAILWAQAEEAVILAVKDGGFPKKTLADTMARYKTDVSPKKKGERAELLRLDAFVRDFPHIAGKQLVDVKTSDLVEWRDARLKVVSPGSVQRDINLLSNVFRVAWKEWQWSDKNPFEGMKAPGDNAPRDRIIKWQEVKAIVRWLGYRTGMKPTTKMQETALAFMVSLRTGMRAGEILTLGDENVNFEKRVAKVKHKTEHITGRPREVPLSKGAIRLLAPAMAPQIFTLTSASLDVLFRRAKANTGIVGLHFHDARADALTRFSRKVDVLTLAKISGHRDLKILQDHYYRVTSEDIAKRLD